MNSTAAEGVETRVENSREEADQLVRSTKKVKRSLPIPSEGTVLGEDENMEDLGLPPLRVSETHKDGPPQGGYRCAISYRAMLQRNYPNLNFSARVNPIWEGNNILESDDDEPVEVEDPTCSTTTLSAEEKRMLREPWRDALIIKMFDKGIRYMQLKKRLRTKWALRGDFSLIDIGHDYYITRFLNADDYEHVMTQGPWLLGDNYVCLLYTSPSPRD